MTTNAFETLLHNLDHLEINHVEIDAQSFKDFLAWYAKTRELKESSSSTRRASHGRTHSDQNGAPALARAGRQHHKARSTIILIKMANEEGTPRTAQEFIERGSTRRRRESAS